MRIAGRLLISFIGGFLSSGIALRATDPPFLKCLPEGIKSADIVSAHSLSPFSTKSAVEVITVAQKLEDIKAKCLRGKLVDRTGKEIRFFRLTGCWGNPPADYLEILQKQHSELEQLKKRYTVIEMTCNPAGNRIN